MTLIEYARLLISDKDPTNQIFSDEELQELIKQNSQVGIAEAQPLDLDRKLWKVPFVHIDDSYTPRIVIADGSSIEDIEASVDFETGQITFENPIPQGYRVFMEAKYVDWDNFRADAYETIAGDYRKLNSFSIQNASEQLDDTKAHLLRLARMYRSARGAEL